MLGIVYYHLIRWTFWCFESGTRTVRCFWTYFRIVFVICSLMRPNYSILCVLCFFFFYSVELFILPIRIDVLRQVYWDGKLCVHFRLYKFSSNPHQMRIDFKCTMVFILFLAYTRFFTFKLDSLLVFVSLMCAIYVDQHSFTRAYCPSL